MNITPEQVDKIKRRLISAAGSIRVAGLAGDKRQRADFLAEAEDALGDILEVVNALSDSLASE